MKIFSLIFSFYLLFLAFEPALGALSFTVEQESCCGNEPCEPVAEHSGDETEEDGCDNGICNPFQSCSSYYACTSDAVLLDLSLNVTCAKPFTETKDKLLPSIAIDFWQPPKIA